MSDCRRYETPDAIVQRFGIMALAHRRLNTDVRDLLPVMEQIGYVGNQTGSMSWSALGFVRGNRPK